MRDPNLGKNELQQWPSNLEFDAISGPEWIDGTNRPQAESISVASVWQMDSPDTADAALAGKSAAYIYRRDGHPNERSLSDKLATLHGAKRAVVTAQGMSAIAAVALSTLQPGAKVWIGNELYGKSSKLFGSDMTRWQVATRVFDPTDPHQISELADDKVDLVLVETLSNPRIRVSDLPAIADATHSAGGLLLVDNTFATHLICRPLEHGADMVVESLSKQVNGHSDSMLGLVAGRDATLMAGVADAVTTFGMASSPLDCYLTHRGLMSLAVRMQRACENALALAKRLSDLPQVQQVDYPGLVNHPQHCVAVRMLTGGYGWMLSFHVKLDRAGVMQIFDALRPDIPFVPSLGDISTTVSHPATTSHRGLTQEERCELGITEGTIRISCGIEPTDWLVDKFAKAIQTCFASV